MLLINCRLGSLGKRESDSKICGGQMPLTDEVNMLAVASRHLRGGTEAWLLDWASGQLEQASGPQPSLRPHPSTG